VGDLLGERGGVAGPPNGPKHDLIDQMTDRVVAAWACVVGKDNLRPPHSDPPNHVVFQLLQASRVVDLIPAVDDSFGQHVQSALSQGESPGGLDGATSGGNHGLVCPIG